MDGPVRFRGLSTVALLTLLSRILGLARDAGMAVLFGAGPLLDAFSLAFRLPNLARRLFGEGALTAAFLPVFVRTYAEDPDRGRRLAWRITVLLASLLAGFVGIVEVGVALAMPWVGGEVAELLELIAWLFPYVLFICLAAQLSAVLHGRGHFFWPAALPVVLNTAWIIAVVAAPGWSDDPVAQMRLIAASIMVAGVIQFLLADRAVSALGMGWRGADLSVDREQTNSAVREVVSTMVPTLLGLTITQANVIVDSLIAWLFSPSSGIAPAYHLVEEGTATALYLGQRLYQFPLGVFGVALGTVLFPVLTKHAHSGDREALGRDLTAGLQLSLCIGLPASVGLLMLSLPIPRVMFEYGEFDAHDALLTSRMIACYGLGVWSMIGLLIVSRAFYAVGDTRTPLRVGFWAVVFNTVLNLAFVFTLGGAGLALATTLASILQLILAMRILERSVARLDWGRIRKTAAKTVAATLVMAVALGISNRAVADLNRYLSLGVPFVAGVCVFAATAWFVKLEELKWLVKKRTESTDEG